jgi:hypothetical protein
MRLNITTITTTVQTRANKNIDFDSALSSWQNPYGKNVSICTAAINCNRCTLGKMSTTSFKKFTHCRDPQSWNGFYLAAYTRVVENTAGGMKLVRTLRMSMSIVPVVEKHQKKAISSPCGIGGCRD